MQPMQTVVRKLEGSRKPESKDVYKKLKKTLVK